MKFPADIELGILIVAFLIMVVVFRHLDRRDRRRAEHLMPLLDGLLLRAEGDVLEGLISRSVVQTAGHKMSMAKMLRAERRVDWSRVVRYSEQGIELLNKGRADRDELVRVIDRLYECTHRLSQSTTAWRLGKPAQEALAASVALIRMVDEINPAIADWRGMLDRALESERRIKFILHLLEWELEFDATHGDRS